MKYASNSSISDALRAARSDPAKVGVLVVLLAILGFMVFRQVTVAPATASASSENPPAPASDANPAAGREANKPSVSPVSEWLSQPPRPLSRNLFDVKLDLFPTDQPAVAGFIPDGPRIWDEIAKSLLDHADQQERKQEMLTALQAQASALQVTSVMMGPKPRAVIHGELVGEGDVVQQFRVLKIEPRRIVVERDGTRLEINIK
jgi:hypothetical protein